MAFERWTPTPGLYEAGEFLLRSCVGRENCSPSAGPSHELFDDGFQAELRAMLSRHWRGQGAVPPALLAMIVLFTELPGHV